MSTARRLAEAASGLVQFFPLSLFATYAFWRGPPTGQRWVAAFELAALAAALQLVILLPRRRPLNRLILGANLYLLIGGAAAFSRQWWVFEIYGVVREAGIFLSMLAVGAVATVGTSAGFVAVADAPREAVRRASLWLLAATALAVAMAAAFRADRTWAAVVPVSVLAVLQGVLSSRLRSPASGSSASSPAARAIGRYAVSTLLVAAAVAAVRWLAGPS